MHSAHATVLLTALVVTVPASAYELARARDGTSLQGVALPVHLEVRLADALVAAADTGVLGARAAAWHASLRWEAPSASALHFRRHLTLEPAPEDGGARVLMRAIAQDWPAEYGSPLATIAFTVVEIDDAAQRIRAAEILLNAQGFSFSTSEQPRRLDVEGTLSHELGHAVGLEHSCGEPWGQYPDCSGLPDDVRARVEQATMYPAASAGNIWQRDLDVDDADGLRALYGGATARPPALDVGCACDGDLGLLLVDTDAADAVVELFVDGERRALVLDPAACEARPPSCRRVGVQLVAAAQAFDLELTDPSSGKRAAMFDLQCPTCQVQPPPPDDEPGCRCGLATGMALQLPWWRARRRTWWRRG